MTSLLPVVAEDTATSALLDLIHEEMLNPQTNGLLVGWFGQIASENPGVLMAVNLMMADSSQQEKSCALIGMAVTYRTLSAQAEIEALNKMSAIVTYPENDRCQSCAKGLAEHDFSSIRKGEIETLRLCAECLHAEDGCGDLSDLDEDAIDPSSVAAYRAELATLNKRLPDMSRDELYSALQMMSIRLVAA